MQQVYTTNLVHTLNEMQIPTQGVWFSVINQFKQMPDECNDGGNDKHFFTLNYKSNEGKEIRMFVAENEIEGLTVMLPSDY